MAQTNLRERAVVEKLNSMAVDLITSTPDIAEATYSDGDLMAEGEKIQDAVAVVGGKCILQSVSAIDTSDTGGAIYLVISDTTVDLGTVGSAINAADSAADNSIAIVELSNWTDIGGAKVCTKGNIGLVLSSTSSSRDLRYGVVNASGGDITIGSGEDIIFKFGVVKD
tara:strand:+ start:48 stop:551 length:504 start_codon:yes stop_codon:yes gene_type:complete